MLNFLRILFSKHKKNIPVSLQETYLGELLHYGFVIFASAWLFQGMRYMNWRETTVKIMLDVFLIGLLILIGLSFVSAFIVAHTVNFVLNGQFYAMFTHMGATNDSPLAFLNKTEILMKYINNNKFIISALAFGSLSRGVYKSTSDLDIRIIPTPGLFNWWKAAFWAVWLRTWSFIVSYPLDLYIFSKEEVVSKMRTDELPVIVKDTDNFMKDKYPGRISFEEFTQRFIAENL